jgi:hemerythrin superfamily protein
MSTDKSTIRSRYPAEDAIALLVADHRSVARLFASYKELKDANPQKKKALTQQICRALTVHTLIEEEIFYPAVRKAIDDDDLMDEALVEHAGAKELIAQLQAASPGDDLYDAKVTVLSEQIEHHVTEEEGNLFPQARGAGVDLEALGEALRARRSELGDEPGAASASPLPKGGLPHPPPAQGQARVVQASERSDQRRAVKKKAAKAQMRQAAKRTPAKGRGRR